MGFRQRRGFMSAVAGVLASLMATGPALAHLPPQFVPGAIAAKGQPRLVVVVVPTTAAAQEAAGHVDYVARQAVERSGRFELVRLIDALDAENAKAREARVREGEAALESARTANNELDSNKALAEADRAMKAFADADLTQHMKDLVGAWIFKIAALVGNGENKAAQLEMDKLLAVELTAQFSRDLFPPDEIAYAEKIRKQYAQADESLEVKTTPSGAEVYVDGHFRGISPVTVKGLASGDHYVTVKAPGYLLAQLKARPGSAEVTLRKAEAYPRYQALVEKVAKDPDGPLRDAAAREFGQWLGVDQVLLAVVDVPAGTNQARITALRLDPTDGHNWAYVQERLTAPGATLLQKADATITSLLAKDDPRSGGPVTHYVEPHKVNLKKTAGYVLLGTGAVALAGGLFFGVQANAKHNEFRDTIQTDIRANTLRSSGRTYAVMADVSSVIGLVAAGSGTYLAFFSEPKARNSAPEEPRRAVRLEEPKRSEPVAPAPPPEKPSTQPSPAQPPPPSGGHETRKKADEERRHREEEARKKREEEERKKREEAERKKKEAEKKISEEEDDLRNY